MPIAIRAGQGLNKQGLNRRQLLVRSAATCAIAGLGSLARPYLSRAADRPLIASGIQSGDVSADSAVIWARADRAARMQVECSVVESFKTILRSATADALPDSDFVSKVLLDGLPYLERYAWFALPASDTGPSTGLYLSGPQVTAVGRAFEAAR